MFNTFWVRRHLAILGGGGGGKLFNHISFLGFSCIPSSYYLTGTHVMFVFISALSAGSGRHDATLCCLYWMSASALKSHITQLCTFLFTFTLLFVL